MSSEDRRDSLDSLDLINDPAQHRKVTHPKASVTIKKLKQKGLWPLVRQGSQSVKKLTVNMNNKWNFKDRADNHFDSEDSDVIYNDNEQKALEESTKGSGNFDFSKSNDVTLNLGIQQVINTH